MTGLYNIHIEGVEQTIRTLKKCNLEVYNETIETVRGAMDQAKTLAVASYPTQPLKGWQYQKAKNPVPPKPFPFYNANQARKGVQTIVNKKTSRARGSYKIAALRQANAGGVVYDMAGSKTAGKGLNGRIFINKLTATAGRASRVMWPAVRAKQALIVQTIASATRRATTTLNKEMKYNFRKGRFE